MVPCVYDKTPLGAQKTVCDVWISMNSMFVKAARETSKFQNLLLLP